MSNLFPNGSVLTAITKSLIRYAKVGSEPSKLELRNNLKKLHYKQWSLKREIRDLNRTIGSRWKKYHADCKYNMIMHPKLHLPMVLQISVPMDIGKYCTRISKKSIEAKYNAKIITQLQKDIKDLNAIHHSLSRD